MNLITLCPRTCASSPLRDSSTLTDPPANASSGRTSSRRRAGEASAHIGSLRTGGSAPRAVAGRDDTVLERGLPHPPPLTWGVAGEGGGGARPPPGLAGGGGDPSAPPPPPPVTRRAPAADQ